MKFKPLKIEPPSLTAVLRAVLLLLTPLAAVIACQTISLQSLSEALSWCVSSPMPVLMYYVPMLLVQLTVTGLLHLSGLGGLAAAAVPLGLTLASYYKVQINGEPLVLADLELAGKLGDVAGFASGRLTVSFYTGIALGLTALPVILLTVLDVIMLKKCENLRRSLLQGLAAAAAGGSMLAVFIPCCLQPYCFDMYCSYPYQAGRDPRLGVSMSLLSSWYGSRPEAAAAYSETRLNWILGSMEEALDRQEAAEVLPHIIFVMNESFSDITLLPDLTFSTDPLSNLHRLQKENTTYGRFYTITCGGGTGQVEMETFTGVSLEELGGIATALAPEMYDAMPSYVRVLKENGYRTVSFHSHTAELYNRDRNYPHLGFDEVIFRDAYEDTATFSGGYFDDDSTAGVIISLFEENRDGPLFLYAMTMQNHQPYTAARYPELPVTVSSPLATGEELAGTACYTAGLYDADRMLGRLADYFSGIGEPVILCFAGDHPPSLSLNDEDTLYTRLGQAPAVSSLEWSAEDFKNMMVTDYIIWTNYQEGEGEVPNSTMAMGATLLELAGVRNTPFFAWMDQTRRETMLFHARILTLDPAGQVVPEDEVDIQAFRTAYTDVIYDMLYGERYIAAAANRIRDP